MYSVLCEYKNMEGNCFLIIIHHANTDIIDNTTFILHKTQNWLVSPPDPMAMTKCQLFLGILQWKIM